MDHRFTFYENHHMDPDFPFIFHRDMCVGRTTPSLLHWHENPEIICFTKGVGIVVCDTRHIRAEAGEIVFIPSGTLHAFYSVTDEAHYHCLIVNKGYHEQLGLAFEGLRGRLYDPRLCELFEQISNEIQNKKKHYRLAARAVITTLLVGLARKPVQNAIQQSPKTKISMIRLTKAVISYLHEHLPEVFSFSAMCKELGYSPYYVAHIFKQVTGQSTVDYLNQLRCGHAYILLSNGRLHGITGSGGQWLPKPVLFFPSI